MNLRKTARRIGRGGLVCLTVALFWAGAEPLFAQSGLPGYGEGRFLVELRGHLGLDFGGDIYRNYRDQNQVLPIGPVTLVSGDATAVVTSYLTRRAAPRAELESVGGSLGVEYALLNWLGIGLSIGQESYSLVNARVFPAGFELGLLPVAILSGGSARASYINGELIYPFAVVDAKDFDRITYGDLNVSLHPLGGEGVVDPYLKLIGGYGRTKADGFQALRYGGALGLRFFVTDWFYVVTEGTWINNDISGEVDTSVGIFESSSEFEGNLVDVQARLGFGFAF